MHHPLSIKSAISAVIMNPPLPIAHPISHSSLNKLISIAINHKKVESYLPVVNPPLVNLNKTLLVILKEKFKRFSALLIASECRSVVSEGFAGGLAISSSQLIANASILNQRIFLYFYHSYTLPKRKI